jgi:alkylated DNA repair dioxygenase AlkB
MPLQLLPMPDAEVLYDPSFWSDAQSAAYYQALSTQVNWNAQQLTMFGKPITVPRLVAWYGDDGTAYTYSNNTMQPQTWIPSLLDLKAQVETACAAQFNSVLLNQYRDGQDSMGWHSDDEPELGPQPIIASVTFGAARRFQFKHKSTADLRHEVILSDGSLLIMRGNTQTHWKHQLPKAKTPCGGRINLTFRWIFAQAN